MTQYNKSEIENKKSKIGSEEGAVIKHDLKNAAATGDWRYMTPIVDKEKCTGCTTCMPFCPEASIIMKAYKSESTACLPAGRDKCDIDYDFCKGCGVCAAVCPAKAITMKKN
jgi:pyruvate ferredoxin oxidoreductase delta subunit